MASVRLCTVNGFERLKKNELNVTKLLSPEVTNFSQRTSDGLENYTLEFSPNTWKNSFSFPPDPHLWL